MKILLKLCLLSIIALFTFSCTQEDTIIENVNQNETLHSDNLFAKISNNSIDEVNQFSKTISDLEFIRSIQINNISNDKSKIAFEIESNLVFLNGVSTSLNNRNFEIEQIDQEYVLRDDKLNFGLSYNTIDKSYFVKINNNKTNLSELLGKTIDFEIERNIGLYLFILDEFSKENLEYDSSKNWKRSGRKYEGTGIGFHTNLSDAEAFCQEDHDQILEDNPGWYSNGISYSCAWDEHLCVCTSNFYSN
jgi:hypothetical protein